MRPAQRIVVVGNGIAGVTAADSLREAGFDGELTIAGDEECPAYSRPVLSKALLLDENDRSSYELPPARHGATELFGVRATRLDIDGRRVILEDKTELAFDRLVIATGSRARRLSYSSGEVTLRGLDDAWTLRGRLSRSESVIVVGGGPLGVEIASACLTAGRRVTLVSRGVPMSAHLGPQLAGIFVQAARERGLTLVDNADARLEHLGGSDVGGEVRVVLADGVVLEADLVVSAVGDVSNTEWLAGTRLASGGGVNVDSRGLVRPDLAAIGDLAAFPTPLGRRRVPLWSSAIEQAKTAGAALLRGEAAPAFSYRPYFWTEQFGLSLKAVGFLPPRGEPTYLEGHPGEPTLMRWSDDGGARVAAALNYKIPIPRLRRLALS